MSQGYLYAAALLCIVLGVAAGFGLAVRRATRSSGSRETRRALEAAAVSVWHWGGNRLQGDALLSRLLGVSDLDGEGIALDALLERVHPTDRESLSAQLESARVQPSEVDVEFRVRAADGWSRLRMRGAGTDASGTMAGALWEAGNRKVELERFAEQLAAAYAASPVAILVTTEDGQIAEVNDTAVAMTGYSRAALLSRSIQQLGFWREQRESFEQLVARLHKGRVLHRIAAFERQDGARRDAELSVTPIERDGLVYHLYMVEDVTKQRRQSVALRESEERFEKMFEISPDPVALISEDGRILEANPAFLKASRYSMAELCGRTTEEIAMWADAEDAARFRSAIASQRDAQNIETVLRRKNGELAHCQVSWAGFEFAGERYVLLIVTDITELKRRSAEIDRLNASLEKMVQARTAQLESANRELESFSYSVSHDLRAPLRHIAGFASLLGERPSVREDAEARRLIGVVIRAAGRMSALIDGLLSFSHVARQHMAMQDVSLDDLAREVVQEFAAAEGDRTIRWTLHPLPVVHGDRALLRSVLVNLVDNALKYSRPRTVAEIEIGHRGTQDGCVDIYVRDNGVGFDMRYAEKLFGVFQRLHAQEEFEGTGVGLANVQRIIERHGGRVWAEGELEKGATFGFRLPLARREEASSCGAEPAVATAVPSERYARSAPP